MTNTPCLCRLLSVGILSAGMISADVSFSVTFVDPGGSHAALQPDIRRLVLAAGADWARYLRTPAGVTPAIEVQVEFGDNTTVNGASATSAFVATRDGYNVFEQGMAAEIRTGTDPNGAAPDVVIRFGDAYLRDELWFDPDPFARLAVVPDDRTDAYSAILHELGHALGFEGWRDYATGSLPLPAGAHGAYRSTWDEHIVVEPDATFFFTGPAAQARYGAPVPLTSGNINHLGNDAPGFGAELLPDLMNGVEFYRGYRYFISTIDVAVMQDIGVPLTRTEVVPPEIRALEPLPGGQFIARWTGANYRLRLEHTASLTAPVWQSLATGLAGTEFKFNAPKSEAHFFRLVAE